MIKKKDYNRELQKLIPGGAHTYSRGSDQYPSNAPSILKKGKGVYVFDRNNVKYLDFGMGLRAINIGYAEDQIDNAAIRQIRFGNNLTRPSLVELDAAKNFVKIIKSADMVKFTKNGSTAVTAAIKLSRAYTGKKYILRCADHPFFSYDDWFIGSTKIKKGVPKEIQNLTKCFKFNDIDSLKQLFKKYKNQVACVVMEPASSYQCPYVNKNEKKGCCEKKYCERINHKNNFLKDVSRVCKKNNAVFILDEMITGFRWKLGGAQEMYGVKPDLSTFGKAISNGHSLAAICGKRKIMKLGSINRPGKERVFLLSTTFGGEMSSLAAFLQTLKFIKKKKVINHLWNIGYRLKKIFNNESKVFGLQNYIFLSGPSCLPILNTKNKKLKNCLKMKTLFMQEMIKNKILMPWISLSYRHTYKEIKMVKNALKKVLPIYKKALLDKSNKLISGNIIKPVFRKYN